VISSVTARYQLNCWSGAGKDVTTAFAGGAPSWTGYSALLGGCQSPKLLLLSLSVVIVVVVTLIFTENYSPVATIQ
jgi:hypothetical protein